jgi:ComF family protein
MPSPFLEKAASVLLNVLYPARCPACGDPSDSFATSPICRECWSDITPYDGPKCRICAEPFTSELAELCGTCMSTDPVVKATVCYGIYDEALRESIHRFKFSSQKRLARPLAGLLSTLELPDVDLMVPVPTSPRGLRERGFSHTLLLSRSLSKERDIPVVTGLLYKKKETPPQVGLSRAERLTNLRGAFSTKRKLKGERVLIVDDVITTGATIRECAKAMRKAGAGDIHATALARTLTL